MVVVAVAVVHFVAVVFLLIVAIFLLIIDLLPQRVVRVELLELTHHVLAVAPLRDGRVGVWVTRHDKPHTASGQLQEDKIAAIGIRLRKWISFHGISLNHDPDLSHFDGIVPCGIRDHGMTSLIDLGLPVTMADLDLALHRQFGVIFQP